MDDRTRQNILAPQHGTDLIARAESDGCEAMKGRYQTAEWIANQAATTLTVLLAGIGGSMAYASEILKPDAGPAPIAAAVLCVYLAGLSAWLVMHVMQMKPIPAQFNDPRCWLYSPGMDFEELRRQALANLQDRIDEAREINDVAADHLNRVRLLAIASPLVLIVGFAAAVLFS